MRVIAGKAKGRKLQMVPGEGTRPITDRAKEALFSILSDWIIDTRVLDLFGGTGAVGIECLSRGAKHAHFIEHNPKAIETIWANLRLCKFEPQATVQRSDSFAFLQKYQGESFNLIFVAPPQYKDLWRKTLQLIDNHPALLAKFGTIVVQIHPREDAPLALEHLQEYDRRHYGSVMLIFYAANEDLIDEDNEADSDEDGWDDKDLDEGDLDNKDLDNKDLDNKDLDNKDWAEDKPLENAQA